MQSPQCFYNPDLFQFNLFSEGRIPNEQDYFYRDIQVARTRSNSVIYGGSNTVLRREALEEIGGFYTGAITEDFATGILMEKKGYVSLGIGEPLASGLSPVDMQGLVQQRVRWGRGVIATGRKMHIYTSPDLSFAQKINYWASIWYWYAPFKRLCYIMSPIMYATFGFMVFKCTLPQVLLFWLPMYISSNINLRLLSGNIRNTKWTGIYETILFPFMIIPIIMESFGITLKKFKVTNKDEQKNQKGKNFLYQVPFLILIILSVIGIINCIFIMFDSGSFGPIVVLFWLFNNLFFLVISILFLDGRVPYRRAERVAFSIPCTLDDGERVLEGVTRDFSETGISVLLDAPYYLEAESEVDVALEWSGYHVKLRTKIVYVSKYKSQWNYAMAIKDYKGTFDDYLQVIYDRVPVLPMEIRKDSGSFEDLKLNTKKRVEAPFFHKRLYPRILLNIDVPCKETPGEKIRLYDFNYLYANIKTVEKLQELTLTVAGDVLFHCVFETEVRDGECLYRVTNVDDIRANTMEYNKLVEWLNITQEKAEKQEKDRLIQELKIEKENRNREFDENKLV